MPEQTAERQEADGVAGAPKDMMPKPKDILKAPMPGPQHVGPDWLLEPDYERSMSTVATMGRFIAETVRIPARWIRENIVLPNKGPKYYWYHRKYPRALPIDECYLDDQACQAEAQIEFERLHLVDRAVLDLLRHRRDACNLWYVTKHGHNFVAEECEAISETYDREETNFFIKYGNLRHHDGVLGAYNKQKCRMIVDRRRALQKQKEEAEGKVD